MSQLRLIEDMYRFKFTVVNLDLQNPFSNCVNICLPFERIQMGPNNFSLYILQI